MNEEKWKPIDGFEFEYEVSNLGRVKSMRRVRESSTGYLYEIKERILVSERGFVNLYKKGVSKRCNIKFLKEAAFGGECKC